VFLTFIKFSRWLYKTLNADLKPWQIALGITFGALAGLLPLGLLMIAVFLLMLLVNLHFGSGLFSFGLFSLLYTPIRKPVILPLGDWVHANFRGFIEFAYESAAMGWMNLDMNNVAGGVALWAVLAIPLFLGSVFMWKKLQGPMREKLKTNKFLKWVSKTWLAKGLRYVFVG
jgi:uncharacterized protein (TIGR03546 family)